MPIIAASPPLPQSAACARVVTASFRWLFALPQASTDVIYIKQKVELFEAFTGFETANTYDVFGANGAPLFMCARPCSPPRAPPPALETQ